MVIIELQAEVRNSNIEGTWITGKYIISRWCV